MGKKITLVAYPDGSLYDEVGDTVWTRFQVDEFADQLPGTCCICEDEITSGFLCLDGGDEACDDCVEIPNTRMALTEDCSKGGAS